MGSRTTLRSVAEAAGVSTAAVSYAFNRPDRLSTQLRARILAVARELGYAGPDATARSLRTGRANAIGVIFTTELTYAFSDPYVLALLGGLTETLSRSRTSLVLIPFAPVVAGLTDSQVSESLDAVRRAVIDGAVADGLTDDHPAVRALADRSLPLVRSSETATGRGVLIDDRQAGRDIGHHLVELGHREVAMLVSAPLAPGRLVDRADEAALYPYSRNRLAGVRDALPADARLRVVSGGGNTSAAGRTAAHTIIAAADPPTAIAADSDVLAAAVVEVAAGQGLRVGHDLSVTGFDDVPAAAPAGLTTVRQPIHEKGQLMARMLLDPDGTPDRVILPTELVVRASTGPAPGRRGERSAT
ncbi:substrate-binding domain-containing protein [Micromonospora sp. PLK6-60]|uniref:LacI family DNA-binding transcriptional regulator n=1 Tax=Micromonospora sp. PLK6-60 TaxID=2873383 RepID=UPI001CA798C9|nr:substrate-binding domain-containing protein [Micromonospora sp. PLK6-60]MBY8872482.1 substrate-binding domain-containing protein [Micromonospora sp. PLK6-60]